LLKSKHDPSLEVAAVEKKTFILHLISQVFNGISLGILLLQDVILKKTLAASDFEVMLLVFLTSTAFLVSIYGTEIVNRSSNRSRTILIIGYTGKLFLILLPFVDNPLFFIVCLSVTAYVDSALLSSWNIVFRHNYSDTNRSKYFSYASTVSTIAILVTATIFGYLLDLNAVMYKIFIPLSGVLGMFVYHNLAKMISYSMDDYVLIEKDPNAGSKINFTLLKDIVVLPIRNVFRIVKENKPFFRFESYFFLYGMAFMVILPAVPIYLVENLRLNYTPISAAKGFIYNSALIIFTPLMGRFHGSKNPTKFCGYIFLILVLYPLMLIGSNYFDTFTPLSKEAAIFITYFIFGIGMSGINIAWSLSTLYYAPMNEVSNYQAVHITLTGIRGSIAPVVGYLIMKIFSIEYTFVLSAFLFLIGGVLMLLESKKITVA
jgi:hypothetical protein